MTTSSRRFSPEKQGFFEGDAPFVQQSRKINTEKPGFLRLRCTLTALSATFCISTAWVDN
jgi:hypothetical protein